MKKILLKIQTIWDYLVSTMRPRTHSLGIARFFSWMAFLAILVSSFALSLFVSSNMRASLMNSQESYSLLLAENMNKQIFRRFTLPVAYVSGRISLADKEQYTLLDDVVGGLMQGLEIDSIRIFDPNSVVTYSVNEEDLERRDLSNDAIPLIFETRTHSFEIIESIPFYKALFMSELPKDSYVLRTVFPLTVDFDYGPFKNANREKEPILGGLEILQDVTGLYRIAIRSQWTIFLGFFGSSVVLFTFLLFISRMAERIISERMQRNKELEEEIYQNEKLVSMGRMVASIAHEIRNPLGIIQSSSEYLMQKQAEKSADAALLGAIYDESRRLGNTVNDFLDYARPRTPSVSEVDLGNVLEKIWAFLGTTFQSHNIQIELDLLPHMKILAEEDVLYRAFYNIFVNAQQAIEKDGFLSVKGEKEDSCYKLSFRDSGQGFPDEGRHVLDPFYTTKDTGTGLGLPIVQSIIQAYNGTIRLYNHEEGGAVIEIKFPIYNEQLEL